MKIHPLTIILLGLFLISIIFNYAQNRRCAQLKEEINKRKELIIILPEKNLNFNQDKFKKEII